MLALGDVIRTPGTTCILGIDLLLLTAVSDPRGFLVSLDIELTWGGHQGG